MSHESEEKIVDTTLFYHENYKRIPKANLERRLDFQEKLMSCLIEIVAIQAKDIQSLEHRNGNSKLYLPAEVRLDGQAPIKLRG